MNKKNIITGSIIAFVSFLFGMCVHRAIVHIDYDKKIKNLRARCNKLKIILNSIYGLTNSKFTDKLKDPHSDMYTRYRNKYTGYSLYPVL